MERRSLRCLPRKSYSELEEPNLDEYVFCEKCADFVYEYCSIHGPLLVIPDDKVPTKSTFPDCVPRAALTIPRVFLHIAPSIIPGAGLGVFSTLTLPRGVRFGPYQGRLTKDIESSYCWQIRDSDNKRSHAVDASDARAANWMRYVNCARHWHEQNLVAYQYRGHIYYRTIKIIPRFTELLVFYGSEFAASLHVDLRLYNSPAGYAQKFGAPVPKKLKLEKNTKPTEKLEKQSTSKENIGVEKHPTKYEIKTGINKAKVTRSDKKTKQPHIIKKYDKNNNKMQVTTLLKSTNPSSIPNETFNLQNIIRTTLICDRCGLIFKCNNTLQLHLKTHESEIVQNFQTKNIDSSKQNDCRKSSFIKLNTRDQNNNLKFRLSSAGEKTYKCEYGKKQFTQKCKLTNHVRRHTGELFTCEYCKKTFLNKNNLNMHIRIHTGEKLYKCDYCKKQFLEKNNLNAHLRIHTGEKPYKCDYCKKQFTQKNHLNSHLRIHTGEKPYKCDYCNKQFTQKTSFNYHLRIHTGEKPYKCDYCKKQFTQKKYLNSHIRIHTGEKPYKCDYCKKQFTQKKYLNSHIRIHTGEKPYKCEYCKKQFSLKSSLNYHLRIHSGEKPYKCDYCKKQFTQKCDLNRHLRIHTGEKPYKCDYCKKQFTQKCDLNKHLRIHTGEKPYKCEYCKKQFSLKSSLNYHLRIHTGEKPYKCKYCNETFRHLNSLKHHNKTCNK